MTARVVGIDGAGRRGWVGIAAVDGAVADDVVDAAVVAWSARRIATGVARPLPDPPEESAGRRVAIWC